MKIGLLTLVFIIGLISVSFGQTVLTDRSKSSAKIYLKSDFRKYKYQLTETDTTLVLTTTDSSIRPVIVSCSFKKDNCLSEKWTFDCDTCYHATFKSMLDKKRFEWKQIGPDRYLSKSSRRLLLAGNTEKHYFTLTMLDMKKEDYEKLLESK